MDHGPRTPRRAITLTEVLISMGILTLGLLGVAALFPVGGFYMQQADISDRGSAIAQSVMNDIVARGMLNPASWYVVVPPATSATDPVGKTFPSDGRYAPVKQPVMVNSVRVTFARPFAHSLTEALNQPTASTDATLIGKQFGSAFVLDPMGIATMAFPGIPPQPSRNGPATTFPAMAYMSYGYYSPISSMWAPWSGATASAAHPWPIRRATFRQPSTGWQLNAGTAEYFFRGQDDLTTDLPQRDDRPARQNWDTTTVGGTPTPLARQWTGDYSWLVTVVPPTNAARDGMARNPEGHSYDVSVVVFHKRPLPPDAQTVQASNANLRDYLNAMGENERIVKATIVSTGLNGGEILLEDLMDALTSAEASNPAAYPQKSAFRNLKTGQWIMLCGPHPNSSTSSPKLVLNWYRVLSIESEKNSFITDPAKQRVISVRGPQWPWQPGLATSSNLCVGICRGAVAVHTKTMRLENPRSSPVSFGDGGSTSTTPPRDRLY
jgi:hypothetical protein